VSDRRTTLLTALKRRLLDTRDQVDALRAACSRFGEDFDEQAFVSAWNNRDADRKLPALAVQAAYENSINGAIRIAQELSQLAGWTPANTEPTSVEALKALRENGVIATAKLHQQLKDAYVQRGSLQHDYANTLARDIHEQARVTLDAVPRLLEDVHLYVVRNFK
jgi:hypothetical protein